MATLNVRVLFYNEARSSIVTCYSSKLVVLHLPLLLAWPTNINLAWFFKLRTVILFKIVMHDISYVDVDVIFLNVLLIVNVMGLITYEDVSWEWYHHINCFLKDTISINDHCRKKKVCDKRSGDHTRWQLYNAVISSLVIFSQMIIWAFSPHV